MSKLDKGHCGSRKLCGLNRGNNKNYPCWTEQDRINIILI